MTLSRRQKLTILALALYWPAVFILAHIPIPALVYEAQVSDKSLHFAVYLVLAFLLWFSISPDRNVRWRKPTVWWAVLVVVAYGVMDELLQTLVGRNCEVLDFAADLAGAVAGFILFTFLAFWPSLLVVTGITIFLMTNLARANVAELLPIASAIYYLLAYGLFTLLWIKHMRLYLSLRAPGLRWAALALVVPGCFLLIVKLGSVVLGKNFTWEGVAFSAGGIAAVVLISLVASFCRMRTQKPSGGGFEGTV
ncbi:MAG TPA: VanZ family protein [Sedimentisphaerales bacterium]|nr:VanZ family protein [Sedimentisphaerales bacterium]